MGLIYTRVRPKGIAHFEYAVSLMRDALKRGEEIEFVWGGPKDMKKVRKVFDGE